MEMTIDEIIGHCNRTCKSAEIFAIERCMKQEDITSKRYWEHYYVAKYLEELKRMKDAEEQGLLLRLPCKVGDKVWGIIRYFFRDRNQSPYEIYECKFDLSMLQEIGKTVFLTKEEAESALAEKGGAE